MNRKNAKAAVLWMVSLILLFGSVLMGCTDNKGSQPGSNSASSSGEDKYAKLPKEVSISMFDRGEVSSDEGNYESNRWTKWIEKESGIKLKVVPVPRGQAQEKLNVLVASEQAPDLIWEYDRNYISKLITQGAVQPIDEYIEKYSVHIKKYLKENTDLKPYITFDGKTYAVTTKRTMEYVANSGIWIRQDWLDKVGKKAPTTEAEFIDVLKAFKEAKLGGDRTVPLALGESYGKAVQNVTLGLFQAKSGQWYLEDGKLKLGDTLDRTQDAIAFEKRLYKEGLIDKEFVTDKSVTKAWQDWVTGKAGAIFTNWRPFSGTKITELLQANPDAKPVPLEPFATKYGKTGLYRETPPFIYVAFNKNMKNPKAAIEYLDWIFEHSGTLVNGLEGTHYKLNNGVPQRTDNELWKKEVRYANEYGVVRNIPFTPEDLVAQAPNTPLDQKVAQLLVDSLKTAMKNDYRRDIPYAPNIPEFNDAFASFIPLLEEIKVKAVIDTKYTPQQALVDLRKAWASVGGEKAEKLVQEWYDKNKASLK